MSQVHIYAPPVTGWKCYMSECPTCRDWTPLLVEQYEWQPAVFTCLECGDCWSDGERLERPFMRGWRGKAVSAAKKRIEKYKEELQ